MEIEKNDIGCSLRNVLFLTFLLFSFAITSLFAQSTNSIKSYRIYSPFQKDSTTIRVLLPDNFSFHKTYKVLYVLPVREQGNRKNGDGLAEIIKNDLHNKYELICVSPEFTHLPWYADHSNDKTRQDESHFLKTILPFVDENYPTIKSKEGRLLIGFSKSGWGALTLLFRNPETFSKAAGWDIGIRMDTNLMNDSEDTEAIEYTFGDLGNFEKYRVSTLLKNNRQKLGGASRIFYYNTEGNRAKGGVVIHNLMVVLGVPHRYLFEPKRKHRWDSGWIPRAVDFLVED
ncbi:MAG: hypothetical protein HN778_20645 [Prolixibacteraceae bacterium]|jgi:hypothetical protein|nr:hypothetical protein [Prolixibacteraceae bacterium]MBT6766484.1 hypothetical protein [Prolixibacteraceae bacterium]MBT7000463.1 hypothetical protein [Prolixibacteraceae bacterium]MBT7397244.1 hypothetical protein [Prolixibacteraceae bacterium]